MSGDQERQAALGLPSAEDIIAFEQHAARRRPIESTEQMKQSRLADTGRADECGDFAASDRDTGSAQHADHLRSRAELLLKVLADEEITHSEGRRRGLARPRGGPERSWPGTTARGSSPRRAESPTA